MPAHARSPSQGGYLFAEVRYQGPDGLPRTAYGRTQVLKEMVVVTDPQYEPGDIAAPELMFPREQLVDIHRIADLPAYMAMCRTKIESGHAIFPKGQRVEQAIKELYGSQASTPASAPASALPYAGGFSKPPKRPERPEKMGARYGAPPAPEEV